MVNYHGKKTLLFLGLKYCGNLLSYCSNLPIYFRPEVEDYPSSEGFSGLDDPEVVGDAEGGELKDERLEGRVGLIVEDGVVIHMSLVSIF